MNTQRRAQRARKKIKMITNRPRLSVHRSNKYLYAQIIDDTKQVTLVGLHEKTLDKKGNSNSIDRAKKLGIEIAAVAKAKKIKDVVFDKGSYKYHGRVKAVAEGAREGGLNL